MQPGGERWRVIDSRVYLERTTTSKHTSATRFATKRSIVVSAFYRLPRSTCVHGVSPRRGIEIFIAAIVSVTPLSSRTWNFIPNPFDCSLLLPTPSLSPLLEAIAVERNGSESTIVYLIATWLEREVNWLISPRTARKIVARFRPIFFQSNHFRDKCQSYRVKGQHPSPCVDLTTSSSLCALLGRAVEFGTRERYSTRYPRGIEEFTWEIHCYVDPLTHGLRIEATLRKFQQSSKTVLQIFERCKIKTRFFDFSIFRWGEFLAFTQA